MSDGMPPEPGWEDTLPEDFDSELAARGRSEWVLGEEIDEILEVTDPLPVGVKELIALLQEPDISEVRINSWDNIRVKKSGLNIVVDQRIFASEEQLEAALNYIISHHKESEITGQKVDLASTQYGLVRVALGKGTRLCIWAPPVFTTIQALFVRQVLPDFTLEDYYHAGGMSAEMLGFLKTAIKGRANILIAGPPGVGKSTLLQAITRKFLPDERIIVLETIPELYLDHIDDCLRGQEYIDRRKPRNSVTLADLVEGSLLMRGDRIIVGEVRGPEAYYLIEASHTGHRGVLCTIHGFTVPEVVQRLISLAHRNPAAPRSERLAQDVAEAVDLVLFLRYTPPAAHRIDEICEVENAIEGGYVTTNTIYKYKDGEFTCQQEPTIHLKERMRIYDAHFDPELFAKMDMSFLRRQEHF